MGLAKRLPFGSKFRIFLQQRHKISGKGVGPDIGAGAHHELQRDLDRTQIDSAVELVSGDKIVQNRWIGIFTPRGTGAKFLLGTPLRFFIV